MAALSGSVPMNNYIIISQKAWKNTLQNMITSIAITFFWKGLTWRPHWVDDDLAEVEQNCHLNFGKDMKQKHLWISKWKKSDKTAFKILMALWMIQVLWNTLLLNNQRSQTADCHQLKQRAIWRLPDINKHENWQNIYQSNPNRVTLSWLDWA